MLSFIIIGKNEGDKLIKCLESIKTLIRETKIEYEIIYVDSKSDDGSFERACADTEIKVFQLKNKCNPAIARNFGAGKAKGNIYCFFDGDMELLPGKFEKLITNEGELIYPIITANRIDVFYDSAGNFIGDNEKMKVGIVDKYEITSGGLMLVEKDLWQSVGGMDESLRCFEDNDFAYRIYRKHRIKILKSKIILVKHHTTRYTDAGRYGGLVFSDYFFYRGKLYRKHIFCPIIIFHLLKHDPTIVILFISILLAILYNNIFFFIIYIIASFIKLFFISKNANNLPLYKRYYMDIIKDIKIISGFFIKK